MPGSQTRERSLRSRSTIITCSAASFSDPRRRSPSGRVPLIGTSRPAGRGGRGRAPARRRRSPSPSPATAAAARSGASRVAQRAGTAGERRREVLHEIDLVDVPARDRGAHGLHRRPRSPRRSRSAPTPRSRTSPRPMLGAGSGSSRTDTAASGSAGTARAGAAPSCGGAARRARSRGRGRLAGPRRRGRRSHAREVRLDLLERTCRRHAARARLTRASGAACAQELDAELEVVDWYRSSAEWIRRAASSTSIVRNGKKPYATVPNASRSQCESVKPAQQQRRELRARLGFARPSPRSPSRAACRAATASRRSARSSPARTRPSPRICAHDRLDVLRGLPGKEAAVDDRARTCAGTTFRRSRRLDHRRREGEGEQRLDELDRSGSTAASAGEHVGGQRACSPSTASRKPLDLGTDRGSGP